MTQNIFYHKKHKIEEDTLLKHKIEEDHEIISTMGKTGQANGGSGNHAEKCSSISATN